MASESHWFFDIFYCSGLYANQTWPFDLMCLQGFGAFRTRISTIFVFVSASAGTVIKSTHTDSWLILDLCRWSSNIEISCTKWSIFFTFECAKNCIEITNKFHRLSLSLLFFYPFDQPSVLTLEIISIVLISELVFIDIPIRLSISTQSLTPELNHVVTSYHFHFTIIWRLQTILSIFL